MVIIDEVGDAEHVEQVQRALVPGHGGPRQPRHVQLGLPGPAPSQAEYYLQHTVCEPYRKVK